MLQLLDADCIDMSNGTSPESEQPPLLTIELSYSTLLRSIIQSQNSPDAQRRMPSGSALECSYFLNISRQKLDQWLRALPQPLDQVEVGARRLSQADPTPRPKVSAPNGTYDQDTEFRMFCYYHRAMYLIHRPWIVSLLHQVVSPDATPAELDDAERVSIERCVESAFAVLDKVNEYLATDMIIDRYVCLLVGFLQFSCLHNCR